MTVLTVVQQAATQLGIERPTAVFGSSERVWLEIQDLLNDVAEAITDRHPWTALATEFTITTGDGSTEAFDEPSDLDYWPTDQRLWTDRLDRPLDRAPSLDYWTEVETRDYDVEYGLWLPFGGQINIKPAPDATETIRGYYQTKNRISFSVGGATTYKSAFTTDADVFRLNERLLKLGLIWRFRHLKGLPYEEDMMVFERALAKEIVQDKPDTVLTVGGAQPTNGYRTAYPFRVP